jgi:glycerol kinase
MQFPADLLGAPILRLEIIERTTQGAAFLAGLATGSGRIREIWSIRSSRPSTKPSATISARLEEGRRQKQGLGEALSPAEARG